MKHENQKKVLIIAVLVALLLTFTVSGTIAFLTDKTEEVQNTFTPTKVDTEVYEEFSGDAKTVIKVENKNDAECVDAYVRVAVVGNWCDSNGDIVEPWKPDFDYNEAYWTRVIPSDASSSAPMYYFYYNEILPVGEKTENLLASGVTIDKNQAGYDGLHLEVTIIQQAIQAEGMDGVSNAQQAFAKAAQ